MLRERSAHIFKVALTHVIEHLDFPFRDGLEDIFVVKRLEESGCRFASRVVSPQLRSEQRVQNVVVGAAVELAKSFKLLWAVHSHYIFNWVVIQVVDV